jgi:hypothetical protein
MRVVGFKELSRKDHAVYYRREFSGKAVVELIGKEHEKKLEFVIEQKPMGGYDVQIRLLEDVDYPLLPFMKNIKSYILDQDRDGRLP